MKGVAPSLAHSRPGRRERTTFSISEALLNIKAIFTAQGGTPQGAVHCRHLHREDIGLIYVTGDMHGDIACFKDRRLGKLRRGDTLFVCGDFGFLWQGGKQEEKLLRWIGRRRYQVLFVDGAHENFARLAEYPVETHCGGQVHRISGNLMHAMRGSVFEIEGKRIFTLGGGDAGVLEAGEITGQPGDCLPTLQELSTAGYNLKACDFSVDYIITHECSGAVRSFLQLSQSDHGNYNHLYAFLDQVAAHTTFKKWLFGCYHLDKVVPPRYMGLYRTVVALDD